MSHGPALVFLCVVIIALLSGFPVSASLIAVSMGAALIGHLAGLFDLTLLQALPARLFGIITNPILIAVPLFVLMGLVLEKSGLAANMFRAAAALLHGKRGGLLAAVSLAGVLMAASTGIVGASVVTLGLLALPPLLREGVPPSLAAGSIAASGTLGQIIPPSIVLIVLADQISNAWQKAQLDSGNFAPDTVSVTDLFAGALLPGLLLAGLFALYQLWRARSFRRGALAGKADPPDGGASLSGLFPPVLLILGVLGSIVAGLATPTEAAAVGAIGAMLLAVWHRRGRGNAFSFVRPALAESAELIAIIFFIVIGASVFSLVFRGFGGDDLVEAVIAALPGGAWGALLGVMVLIFLLGFVLEFLEITFMVVPLVAPVLLAMPLADGSTFSPVWLAVLIALNLQTSFLTPPFGVSLFYLRGVAPETVKTGMIYRGVAPFIVLQLAALALVMAFPALATWLPRLIAGP